MDARGLIEVFTSGCSACEGTIQYANELAADGGHEVRVWNTATTGEANEREQRMRRYGIHELPAIVIDGELLACCG